MKTVHTKSIITFCHGVLHVHIHVYTVLIRMTYCTYRKYYNILYMGSYMHMHMYTRPIMG